MSGDSPCRPHTSLPHRGGSVMTVGGVSATIQPQVVSDRSVIDSAIGFINEVTLAAHQQHADPKDTIVWARFESGADLSDPRFGVDWEIKSNMTPPLLLVLGFGIGVQVWAIPANGEAVEVLSWRHGIVTALCVLPTPSKSNNLDMNDCNDSAEDLFADKRPLIALVDGHPKGSGPTTGCNPQMPFSSVSFVSLKTGMQVKTIKFKNPIIDVLSNRNSVVITFNERIAVFDAWSLEDRLSITSCYPSPGINSNPVALGARWLAYAETKLIHSKRSSGGCDGEGVASYTATVLNAAKSFGKGLRELGEHVAAGLTGSSSGSANLKINNEFGNNNEAKQPGVVTIIDVMQAIKDYSPTSGTPHLFHAGSDPIIAHFIAHSDALVKMEFDNSGMLLLTADRRGHDFHVFRIQPHPVGSNLSAVHHLYVLHRGDTTSKVQNIAFSSDSRWVAVSTLRGTTHVFPITPYGGLIGVRTHASLHVVNKLSRFHRSAGLTAEGRSSSPISYSDSTVFNQLLQPYHNPTLPPFPRPTIVMPLAQLRQPIAIGSPPGSAGLGVSSVVGKSGATSGGKSSQRQRLSSLSDDSVKPLSVCAIFAKSRAGMLEPTNIAREAPHRMQRKPVDSLFIMAGHGALIQYDLDTKLSSSVAKEKVCDDTPIELVVEAKAQWNFGRRQETNLEIMPPLSPDNWLIVNRNSCNLTDSTSDFDDDYDYGDSWLSQVEIVTHAGPHRRLWMGPQFVFKTYDTPSGSNLNHVDVEAVEIGISKPSGVNTGISRGERSSPLNMPLGTNLRSSVPVLIESGSYSSIEHSPKFMDRFRHDYLDSDCVSSQGDSRLKEDLADAMRESPYVSTAYKENGCYFTPSTPDASLTSENVCLYNALITPTDEDKNFNHLQIPSASTIAVLASALPNIFSYETNLPQQPSVEKYVNPLGTVTNITVGMTSEVNTDILDEVVAQLTAEDNIIHENCDESLFRPVVAIFCDENERKHAVDQAKSRIKSDLCRPPEEMGTKLIVPVIAKEVNDQISKLDNAKKCSKTFIKLKNKPYIEDKVAVTKNKSKSLQKSELSTDNKPISFDQLIFREKTEKQDNELLKSSNMGISLKSIQPVIGTESESLKNKRSKKTQNVNENIQESQKIKNEIKVKSNLIICTTLDDKKAKKTLEVKDPKRQTVEQSEFDDDLENIIIMTDSDAENLTNKITLFKKSIKGYPKNIDITSNPFKTSEYSEMNCDNAKIEIDEKNEPTSYTVKVIDMQNTNVNNKKKINKSDISSGSLPKSTNKQALKKSNRESENKTYVETAGSAKLIVTQLPALSKLSMHLPEELSKITTGENINKKDAKTFDTNQSKEKVKVNVIEENFTEFITKNFQNPFGCEQDDFDILKPLATLPPLPDLEPLKLDTTSFDRLNYDVSDIDLISSISKTPAQEKNLSHMKFNDPLMMCQSVLFEKEAALQESLTCSTSSYILSQNANEDEVKYKNITEVDSLEILKEEKKLSKRQKRKLHKHKKESASTFLVGQNIEIIENQREDDEELRPLIDKTSSGLSDSQPESVGDGFLVSVKGDNIVPAASTDSEGSMPITTSDENVSSENFKSSTVTYANKVKTKKIDHQINLSAAIEAAASSSTSTAEESGEENATKRITMKADSTVLDNKVSMPLVHATAEPSRINCSPDSAVKVMTKKNSKQPDPSLEIYPFESHIKKNLSCKRLQKDAGSHKILSRDDTECAAPFFKEPKSKKNSMNAEFPHNSENLKFKHSQFKSADRTSSDEESSVVDASIFEDEFKNQTSSSGLRKILKNNLFDSNLMHFSTRNPDGELDEGNSSTSS